MCAETYLMRHDLSMHLVAEYSVAGLILDEYKSMMSSSCVWFYYVFMDKVYWLLLWVIRELLGISSLLGCPLQYFINLLICNINLDYLLLFSVSCGCIFGTRSTRKRRVKVYVGYEMWKIWVFKNERCVTLPYYTTVLFAPQMGKPLEHEKWKHILWNWISVFNVTFYGNSANFSMLVQV